MNAFRKLVSGRLAVERTRAHCNADTLAAFAENALAPREREAVLAHLAQCADCRNVAFLSLPPAPDVLSALAPAAKRQHVLMVRWGAIAAGVTVAAAVFVARHDLGNRQSSLSVRKAPVAADRTAPASVAEHKVPARLDAMQAAGYSEKVSANAVRGGHPEPKHATAQPKYALTFEKSGEVRMAAPPTSGPRGQLPLQNGRNTSSLADGTVSNPPAPRPSASEQKEPGYLASGPLMKQLPGTAEFSGVVVDSTGGVVPNAKVTAMSPTGSNTAIAGPNGEFYFAQLPTGFYALKAEAPGFRATELPSMALVANKPASIRVTLTPGAATEAVEVTGGAADAAREATISKLDSNVAAEAQPVGGPVASRKKTATQAPASVAAAALPQWTLSAEGTIQKSSDQGHSWEVVPFAGGVIFRALSTIGTHVWAGGKAGLLYHSADSGRTWTQVFPADVGQKLQGDIVYIGFSDTANGSVRTDNGQLWTTSDSGQAWHLQ
jgi:hypothetical protein